MERNAMRLFLVYQMVSFLHSKKCTLLVDHEYRLYHWHKKLRFFPIEARNAKKMWMNNVLFIHEIGDECFY